MVYRSESWKKYIPDDIKAKYEIYDYKHAAAILYCEFPEHFNEICGVLRQFIIKKDDITSRGGNESNIPKKFSDILRPLGWEEKQLHAKVVVDDHEISHDTHWVDYLKGRVAFDLEWNSKDQTYDRDLYAFKSFFDYDKISVAILVTRSTDLNYYFSELGTYFATDGTERKYMAKYGASTTQMGKLLPRLEAGRNGGCPILVFGITRKSIIEEP